ncbi:MAG TPA: HisA/HisF-related TIM barrel protein [Gemmatirosa sp.]
MRLIGVLDLRSGRAVHARRGVRAAYAPVADAAGTCIDGDPLALARTYRDVLGVRELYAADLDAIQGRPPQQALAGELAALGMPLWLDAGVTDAGTAQAARATGAVHVVVGLETLRGPDTLPEVCAAVGAETVAFSLDLRAGVPMLAPSFAARLAPEVATPIALAGWAAACGVGAILVLDLARVGSGDGVDLALVREVRHAAPGVRLLAGGGVRGPDDLERLADAGCDGALVASALHDGRIGRQHVAEA